MTDKRRSEKHTLPPEANGANSALTVGILGGSFNPPHRGHLALARTVLDEGLADSVVLIPAATPPHKAVPRQADAETRLTMANLLASEDDRIDVDDIELRRQGKSYTIDTLRRLIERNPDIRYRLIIGSDLAKTFATWREYHEILRLAPPLVAERPDDVFGGPEDFSGLSTEDKDIIVSGRFDMQPVDISSTKVRALLATGADDGQLLKLVTAPVLMFIRECGLYGPDDVAEGT